jgi:hypothetical protein
MKSIHRWSASVAVVAVIGLGAPSISGQASLALAHDKGDLGDKIAGTYLAVQEDGAQVLQIGQDGNLSVVFSIQFTRGGVLGESFSDTLGSWKKTGRREVTARTVDLTFQSGNGFFGVAAATYVIEFDKTFETAIVTCEGTIFPPGVNPFDADAEPIAGSGFSCGPRLEFHRIPIEGENENHR